MEAIQDNGLASAPQTTRSEKMRIAQYSKKHSKLIFKKE